MGLFGFLAKILYIGHSLVGPDLPVVVEGGLRAMDEAASVRAQIINGAPLKFNFEHSAEAQGVDGRAELQKAETEVLILTEAIPLAEHLKWNDTPGQIVRFAELARAMKPGVRVFFYETWHSRNSGPGTVIEGDPGAGTPWRERLITDLPLWEGAVRDANSALGDEVVALLPAGQAMGLLADAVAAGEVPDAPSLDVFFSDDIHLSEKGEYYIALVHMAAITGKSPEGLPARLTRAWKSRDGIVSEQMATVLQRLAWQAVSTYQPAPAPAAKAEAAPVVEPDPTAAVAAPPATSDAAEAVMGPLDLSRFTPVTNPHLALGLNGVADWSVQQPFLNILKTAREWTGHLPGQFGGWDHARLQQAGVLDANGWPTAIPAELTGLSLLFLTDLPADAEAVAGRYRLSYRGQGDISLAGRATVVEQAPGSMVFDYTPGEGTVSLTLTRTDPADPIRDMVVVREDRAALLAQGQLFNPDWLARIRGVVLIRLMDWMKTNDSTLARLADRPKPEDYTWSRNGVPVEVMIALANELGADPWFTLPHLAEDDLVRFYAQAAHDGLKPELNAHVEYSNEVWNWQFAQAGWAEEQGRALWGGESKWVQYYALRAAQIADIWAEVYGTDAPSRLTRVIATQTGWLGLEDQIFNAPDIIASGAPAPASHFDAYAVTGYFSGMVGGEDKAAMVDGWLDAAEQAAQAAAAEAGLSGKAAEDYAQAHRFDTALPLAIAEIAGGAESGDASDTLDALLAEVLPHHARVAAAHNLKLVMYEGGTHVVGLGPRVSDPRLTAFLIHLNYSEEMAALYDRLMQGWAALTPAPFNAFVDVSAPSQWGSWGALRHLGDENPRWQALAKGCWQC